MNFLTFLRRYIKEDISQLNNSSHSNILPQESCQIDSSPIEPEALPKELCFESFSIKGSEYDSFDSEETSKSDFVFKFQFPTYEEFSRSHKESDGFGSLDTTSPTTNSELKNEFDFSTEKQRSHSSEEPEITSSSNKYEVLSGQSLSCFIDETQVSSFSVAELYTHPNHGDPPGDKEEPHFRFFSGKDFVEKNSRIEAFGDVTPSKEEETEKLAFTENPYAEEEKLESSENDFPGKQDVCDEDDFLTERNFVDSDSESESISSSHEFSVISPFIGSTNDGFLTDTDFEGINDFRTGFRNFDERNLGAEKDGFEGLDEIGLQGNDFEEEDEDIMEELGKLEESEKFEDSNGREEKPVDGPDSSGKKPNSENSSASDLEDPNGFDTLWEHQELIEQLKMELKKVRATGLPTIFEDSECPKMMEDLKPWKIDEKFQHGDKLSELHKVYKSYRERMRKLDILNYQKMYAIGQSVFSIPFLILFSFNFLQFFLFLFQFCKLLSTTSLSTDLLQSISMIKTNPTFLHFSLLDPLNLFSRQWGQYKLSH